MSFIGRTITLLAGAGATDPLRASKEFRRLWLSILCANSGRWSAILALLWLTFDLSSSELAVGMVGAATFGPLLLAPVGGWCADWLSRPRLIAAYRCAASIAIIGVALLAATELATVTHAILVGGVIGLTDAGTRPARMALMAEQVGEPLIAPAAAMSTIAMVSGQVVAAATAGAAMAAGGPAAALALGAVWFGVA